MKPDRKLKSRENERCPSKLTDVQLASFLQPMAMLLQAGIAPLSAVDLLLRETRDARSRNILSIIRGGLSDGQSLRASLGKTGVFPDAALQMLEIGELTGETDVVMARLGAYYRQRNARRRSLRNALLYPVAMILLLFLIVVALTTQMVPVLRRVYAGLGQVSGAVDTLVQGGHLLTVLSLCLSAVFAAAAVLILILFHSQSASQHFLRFCAGFSPVRRWIRQYGAAGAAETLALSLRSGLDTFTALSLSADAAPDPETRRLLLACPDKIRQGASLADALGESGLFADFDIALMKAGEQTGSLDAVLEQTAERERADAAAQMENAVSVAEPTLVIILSAVVGLVLLSMILPLMGILSAL